MQVLFELRRIGNSVRVTAIDEETGTEAVIQGPATLSTQQLQTNALAKLRYILEKQKKGAK